LIFQFKDPVKLIVFDSGESLLARQYDIDTSKHFGFIIDDYISIDLNNLVKKRYNNDVIKTDYINYSLSKIEQEVHHSLLIEEVQSIKINTKKGDEYIIDKEFILASEREMKILFSKLNYADSVTTVRGNKTFHKIIEKKKIKK